MMSARQDRYLWDRTGHDPEIAELEALLRPLAYRPRALGPKPSIARTAASWRRRTTALLATAAVLTGVVLGAAAFRFTWPEGQAWRGSLAAHGAAPREVTLAPGGTIRTGPDATAVLDIARVGRLTVLPGSTVRMVETGTGQHRLQLRSGAVHARVWAPPGHFGISVGNARAVDLGCEFDLRIGTDGRGYLRVHSGWVQLEGARESAVPQGAAALIDPVHGPGTPYRVDAATRFKHWVGTIDARIGAVDAHGPEVSALIATSESADAITFVSLLQRYPHLAQGPLFDHTRSIFPQASAPDRTLVAAGSTTALDSWWDALPYPKAKRWWLHWRDALTHAP
jgi:ferric-dicitrate binding protein FerR (iron transport regulator)